MTDDEMMIRWVKGNGHYQVADRLEALLAERVELVGRIEQLNREAKAVVNPSEGRVPVSWDECADWREWFGREAVWCVPLGHATDSTGDQFRRKLGHLGLADYRLLPPPNLVAAPEGMDGGGWLGQGKDVPDGWPWRATTRAPWTSAKPNGSAMRWLVQCRPPVRVRAVVEVPLTRLVGRTIEGCEDAVTGYRTGCLGVEWLNSRGGWFSFPAGSLDLDTGRVKVEPEGEQ